MWVFATEGKLLSTQLDWIHTRAHTDRGTHLLKCKVQSDKSMKEINWNQRGNYSPQQISRQRYKCEGSNFKDTNYNGNIPLVKLRSEWWMQPGELYIDFVGEYWLMTCRKLWHTHTHASTPSPMYINGILNVVHIYMCVHIFTLHLTEYKQFIDCTHTNTCIHSGKGKGSKYLLACVFSMQINSKLLSK